MGRGGAAAAARPSNAGPGTSAPAAASAHAGPLAPDSGFKDAFLARIRDEKKFFYGTVVAQAQRIDVGPDQITFSFAANHRALRAQLEQNRPWLEGIAQNVIGRRVTVASDETAPATAGSAAPSAPRAAESGDEELRARAMENEGVQALLDVFSAEIKEIEEIE
jgi:hypothetical protein